MRTDTCSDTGYHPSEVSTIGPSQSASQVNVYVDPVNTADPSIIPNAPNPILGANGSDIQRKPAMATVVAPLVRPNSTPPATASSHGIRSAVPRPRTNSLTGIAVSDKPAPGFEYGHNTIQVPPAHAIQDAIMPTVVPSAFKPETTRTGSGYLTPVSNEDGDDCSKEDKLIKEGKLQVVENPRYQQGRVVSTTQKKPVREVVVERTEVVTAVDGMPQVEHEEVNVVDVREIRQEDELPQPSTEPPPGVPASVPTGEPQTPRKTPKRSGSPSPQKSKFLGSLKKVFGGAHRDTGVDEEKAREKEEKAKEKEEKKLEKEEKKMEKARERETRREERKREQEERKEERERDKEVKTRVKQEQKRERRSKREAKFRADSSTEDEDLLEGPSIRRRGGKTSGFIGMGKKERKWTSRTDKNLSEIRRESLEADRAQGPVGGFIVRQNTDLQKNLRGGIITAGHVAPFDLYSGRVRISSDVGGHSTSLGGMEGGERLKGRRASTTGASFVVERGVKVSRRSSAPPRAIMSSRPEGAFASSSTAPFPATSLAPRTETKFWEDFSSRTGSPSQATPVTRDRGYVSDTGAPAAAVGLGVSGVERKPSKKKQTPVSRPHGELGRHSKSLSAATAPVGISAPGSQTVAGGGRRAVSVDYGRHGRAVPVTSPRAPHVRTSVPTTGFPGSTVEPERPQESLMTIVDNLTRSNRQAWELGLMELGKTSWRGADAGTRVAGTKMNSVGALHGTEGAGSGRRYANAYATTTGKDGIVPMEVLPSLPVEEQRAADGLAPPVIRVGSVGEGVGQYKGDAGGDDDSASTTSYETGHENLESTDEETPKRRAEGVGASTAVSKVPTEDIDRRPLSMPSPILFSASGVDGSLPHAEVVSPGPTPQKRKSVRVSLNPTFSPTPPAIEDEEDRYMRAPFVFREPVAVPSVATGNQSYQSPSQVPPQVPDAYGTQRDGARDIWDDDSDENAEYQQAKRLLMRATMKEKDVMW